MTEPIKLPKEKQQLKDVESRLKDRKKYLEEVWYNVELLTEKIVDAANGDRERLVKQRLEDLQEADLVQAEVNILINRRKVAYLKIFTLALEKAKQELNELVAERHAIGESNYQADRLKRAAMQQEIQSIPDRKKRDQKVIELEVGLADVRARALVNQKNIERARNTIRRCEMELGNAELEVAKW